MNRYEHASVKTGNLGLDGLVEGSLVHGSVTLLRGASRDGKIESIARCLILDTDSVFITFLKPIHHFYFRLRL